MQAKVFDVIRKETGRGLPFVLTNELDRIMGDDIDRQQIYSSLQGLRRQGHIELVPGVRGAVRPCQNAPASISDGRKRKKR